MMRHSSVGNYRDCYISLELLNYTVSDFISILLSNLWLIVSFIHLVIC